MLTSLDFCSFSLFLHKHSYLDRETSLLLRNIAGKPSHLLTKVMLLLSTCMWLFLCRKNAFGVCCAPPLPPLPFPGTCACIYMIYLIIQGAFKGWILLFVSADLSKCLSSWQILNSHVSKQNDLAEKETHWASSLGSSFVSVPIH